MYNKIRGKQIIIVDDESDLTLSCRTSLEYHGFGADTFNEPKEALSNFKSNYYDLVILDIIMDGMNGFELYKEIKKKDPSVKACFLTACDLYRRESRIKEYSTIDKELFIRKPIGNEELIEIIERLISKEFNT